MEGFALKKFIALIITILFLTGCSNPNPSVSQSAANPPDTEKPSATEPLPTPSVQPSPSVAQTTSLSGVTTPVLVKGLLMGGLTQGKWMLAEEFFNSSAVDLDGYLYDVYVDNKKMQTATGSLPMDPMSGEFLTGNAYIPGFDVVELYDNNGQKVDYDIAIRADWDLFPGNFSSEDSNDPAYADLFGKMLEKEGLPDAQTQIKQVVRVDLDNNGKDEILIAADNTVEDRFEQVKAGDNAILLFKSEEGSAAGQVLEKDIRLQDETEISIYRWLFRVHAVADLDGDGVMEVVVRSWYYEGESWEIYKLDGNELKLVASNGWGA